MIGMGYESGDAGANWKFFYNDGAGTATKVDLATDAVRANVSHGYDMIIYNAPNSGVFYVFILNIHLGTTVLNTSYNTDVPAVNVGLCTKHEVNNGAVAAACDIDYEITYLHMFT
jgi:hypothetical protein